jgi:vitamin B12 transporter
MATFKSSFFSIACMLGTLPLFADSSVALVAEDTDTAPIALPELEVSAGRIANPTPAGTFAAPISRLDLEPMVDVQSRNLTEAQGDVTVRGGIFENTGFSVGGITLFDPQTGHYFAEIPIAPEFLSGPEIFTGAQNALRGFNSSVGTIGYDWTPVQSGGQVTVGFGDKNLNYQRLLAGQLIATRSDDWQWGIQGEASRSEGDGTRPNGDHDFERFSGRVQLAGPASQTDFFAGYQAKYFAWPNLYTPFGNESENLKTRLFMLHHRQDYDADSYWRTSAYHRRNSDFYYLNAFGGLPFQHETRALAASFDGKHTFDENWAIHYFSQVTQDRIRSTSLENHFLKRAYVKVAVVPEYRFAQDDKTTWVIQAGGAFDDSDRDSSAVSPIFELAREYSDAHRKLRLHAGYAEATQVPGYTAIGGPEMAGLFRSRRDLGRERSRNLETGVRYEVDNSWFQGTVFHRWDDDLVDWTFASGAPNARRADNVDIEVFGVEAIAGHSWERLQAWLGYTYLNKSADYGSAAVDASFYALNHPRHRITLSGIFAITHELSLRVDNEYRRQVPNALRQGRDNALTTHAELSWRPERWQQWTLRARVDNLWKTDFQEVPGTPGRLRQTAVDLTYAW